MNTNIVLLDGFEFQYRADDYINLTLMCKQTDRKFNHYFRTKPTKDFIEAVSLETNIPVAELIQKRVGGIPTQQGTYGHPLIAIHLAQWCSPEIALAVTKLTKSYLTADINLAVDIINRTSDNEIDTKGKDIASVIINRGNDKTLDFIEARVATKKTNKELNRALSECPKVSRAVFPMAQNSMYKATYGKPVGAIKKEKGLGKNDSLRDTMTTDELVHLAFCESMSSKVLDKTKPEGDGACSNSVYETSKKIHLFEQMLISGSV